MPRPYRLSWMNGDAHKPAMSKVEDGLDYI